MVSRHVVGGCPHRNGRYVSLSRLAQRSASMQALLEPWAAQQGVYTKQLNDSFIVALEIASGTGKEAVVRSLVDRLREMGAVLSVLPPGLTGEPGE